jgi:hypothetical protein
LLLQQTEPVLYLIAILIGTIIVTLVLFLAVMLIESNQRAKDKLFMIIIIALFTVVVLPIIMNAIAYVFNAIGSSLASIRNAIDNRGQNHMIFMVPIFGFLILLAVNKYLLDISWETALWITLILLFVLFLMFCLLPELEQNFVPNPLL